MGRKSDSLQHVLIKRVLPQVQNNKTGTAYKKHIKKFARWAKSVGYRTPEQITPDVVQDYEQYLEHHPKQYAPTTIHTYLAPVCAAAGVSMDRIRKPKRTSGTITRGRDHTADGQVLLQNRQGRKQESSPKYARLVALQRVTGIRRAELGRLTGADLVRRGHSWYIVVRRGKGGKTQEQYILPKDVETVRKIFEGVGPDDHVFSREEMNNKINLHGLRAQHGRDCYEHYVHLAADPATAEKLRSGLLRRWEKAHRKLHEEDPGAWQRQRDRFIKDMDDRPYVLRGENAAKATAAGLPTEYNRLALMCVSVYHLSHWRLDVTVTNYML